jgi:hypothetical protein
MPIRRKKGKPYVVSSSQTTSEGRYAPIAEASKPRLPPVRTVEEAALSVTMALGEVAVLRHKEAKEPGAETIAARRLAEKRARHARWLLRKLAGKDAERAMTVALTFDGGLMLRAAVEAETRLRERAIASLVTFAAIAREHNITSTAALITLSRSARWEALSGGLLDLSLQHPNEAMTKLALATGAQARLDLVAALQLEVQGREARAQQPSVDVSARLDAVLRERQARQLEAANTIDTTVVEHDDQPTSEPDVEASSNADALEVCDEPAEDERKTASDESNGRSTHSDGAPPLQRQPPVQEVAVAMPIAPTVPSPMVYDARLKQVVYRGDNHRLDAADNARPSAWAIQEMRRRGLDVSRWETKETDNDHDRT